MKKNTQNYSCREVKRPSLINLNTLEIEENPSGLGVMQVIKSGTIAQRIPKLPESKFFPTTRRGNISLDSGAKHTSFNTSSNPVLNNTANKLNSSSQSQLFKDTSGNFSMISTSTEPALNSSSWADMKLPTTPLVVIGKFNEKLSRFELVEILKYPQIWFIGLGVKKIESNGNSNENYGFDDESGDFRVTLHDHVGFRFEVFEVLGKGSFGQVFKVFDHKHKIFCALKIIKNKKRFNQQAAVEVEVLRLLRKKDEFGTIVQIQSSFLFRNHVCITFELLSMNLYHFLKLNKFQGLSMGLIRRFSMQILQALAVLRKAQVIHCDLKPENILLKSSNRSAIKVIDFGSSCFSDKKIYTYIQSRFYRAPEVILGISYTTGIDMWSFGCILCELFTGYPLFPGENETQQLLMIVELIGYPGTEVLAKASRKKLFFDSEDRLKVVQDSKGRARQPASRKIERVLQGAEPEFVDLVQRCLVWNPSLRITPEEALAAQWIGDVCKKGKNGPQAESCKNLKRQQFDFTD